MPKRYQSQFYRVLLKHPGDICPQTHRLKSRGSDILLAQQLQRHGHHRGGEMAHEERARGPRSRLLRSNWFSLRLTTASLLRYVDEPFSRRASSSPARISKSPKNVSQRSATIMETERPSLRRLTAATKSRDIHVDGKWGMTALRNWPTRSEVSELRHNDIDSNQHRFKNINFATLQGSYGIPYYLERAVATGNLGYCYQNFQRDTICCERIYSANKRNIR